MASAVRRIQSIEVGFRLIRVLEGVEMPLPLKEIAAAARMPPSKAYIYLASFAKEGLVRQDPETGYYGLGPFAFQLGLSAIRQSDVVQLAKYELESFRAATRLGTYVCLWSNRGPVIAVKVDGERQGAMSIRVGFVLPLLTATGRVFQAWLPRSETASLATEQKVRKVEHDLEATLEKIRRGGFANSPITRPSMMEGFFAMSAPIFDYSGQIVATIAILGPTSMFADRRGLAQRLIATASRLSAQMGAPQIVPGAKGAHETTARRSGARLTEPKSRR